MRASHPRLRAVAPLVVAATLALAATASGLQPSPELPIPDSAFRPVLLADRGSAGAPTTTRDQRPVTPLAEPLVPTPPPERPQPLLPVAQPISVRTHTHSVSGRASWYCNADDPSVPYSICHRSYPDGPGFDAYGAAGPGLRAALGAGWRNTVVLVCGRRCVEVKLVDWCKCTGGSVGTIKLIDLYQDVYARTGGNVTIRW
jgi:hypothetical protein